MGMLALGVLGFYTLTPLDAGVGAGALGAGPLRLEPSEPQRLGLFRHGGRNKAAQIRMICAADPTKRRRTREAEGRKPGPAPNAPATTPVTRTLKMIIQTLQSGFSAEIPGFCAQAV